MTSEAEIGNDLLDAASDGCLNDLERLISAGADPNFRDVLSGGTCLHHTVGKGDLAATQLLLACGADPNIATCNTSTSPLGIAALSGHRGLVDLLLSVKATLSNGEIATGLLMECCDAGFADIANAIDAAMKNR